ncbi:MAG: multiprotein bridging factor aMBF1 [Candidatus Hodarchaeota archaeon]
MPLGFDEKERRCPICNGIVWKGQKVLIEGARITLCDSCARLGKKITTKPKSIDLRKSYSTQIKGSLKHPTRKFDEIEQIEIVNDYSKRIRNIRTINKLNQDQFAQKLNEKPSLIRRIESGKVKPTIKLAKKIEEIYKITLLIKADEIEVNTKKFMKKETSSALGDIAFFKKKK